MKMFEALAPFAIDLLGANGVVFQANLHQQPWHSIHAAQRPDALILTATRPSLERGNKECYPFSPRKPLAATFTIGAREQQGVITDISIAGCALGAETSLEIGDILRLELQLPNQTQTIDVQVAILRGVHSNHSRLEFIQFKTGDKERLQKYIYKQISNRPSHNS